MSASLLPKEAIARCGRYASAGVVSVRTKGENASYGGLVTCGSVWHCPFCAARIAEGRKKEIRELVEKHRAAGGTVWMTALTIPHDRFDTCAELRDTVSETWRKVQAGNPWKRASEAAGLLGMVRALEVTHGGNGWHPHLHVLLLFEPGALSIEIQQFGIWLFERWANRIAKAGFGDCNPAIFRFEETHSPEAAGDYVAKWGPEAELVSGHTKKSKHGRTPWMLLEAAANGDRHAGALFQEYGYAFKGARQLTWTRGLREHYGLRDIDDAELAEREEEEGEPSVTLGTFGSATFARLRAAGLQLELLEAVETLPVWETVRDFLVRHRIPVSQWAEL